MPTRSNLRDGFAMVDDVFALSPISARAAQPSEADYEAIRDAFMETSRGRWFLGEYAKRNRNADTSMVLDAVARIEHALAAQREQQQEQQFDERALPEALAVIRAAVEDAAAAAGAAIDRLALEHNLAPVRKGTRIIKEISWRWREIGADSRICDLIDTQIEAIESGCDQLIGADPRAALLAAFDSIRAGLNAFETVDGAVPPATAELVTAADAPPAGETAATVDMPTAESALAEAARTPAEVDLVHPLEAAAGLDVVDTAPEPVAVAAAEATAEPAAREASELAAPGHVEAPSQVGLDREPVAEENQRLGVTLESAHATLELAEIEVEAAATVSAVVETADEVDPATADAQDEAVLELVAAEMAAPDLIEDEDLARVRTIGFDIQEPAAVDDDIVATFADPTAPEPATFPAPTVSDSEPPLSLAVPPALQPLPLAVAPEPQVAPAAPEFVPPAPVMPEPTEPAAAIAPQPAVATAAQAMPKPSYEPSLGSALLANGLLPRKPMTANDPLMPIRRMTQPEKIAFFS
ncbi:MULTISPECIES: hypothetical protein [unclassified Bradyrhizobium]|uniref:hypothetical protein n=1 Tax=unclassified Bradyrhizobium TaxID=2631580 RepID=UPI00291704E3|nr:MULTISPECIES: hypothetical protein [unclassified Bradyrhizobium]